MGAKTFVLFLDQIMTDKLIVLYTSTPQTIQEVEQRRLDDLLSAKKLLHQKVDGAAIENKELRSHFFELSKARGQ